MTNEYDVLEKGAASSASYQERRVVDVVGMEIGSNMNKERLLLECA